MLELLGLIDRIAALVAVDPASGRAAVEQQLPTVGLFGVAQEIIGGYAADGDAEAEEGGSEETHGVLFGGEVLAVGLGGKRDAYGNTW